MGRSGRHGCQIEILCQPGVTLFAGQCEPWRSSCQPDAFLSHPLPDIRRHRNVRAPWIESLKDIPSRSYRSLPRISTITTAPTRDMTTAARKIDDHPLRRIPVPSRRPRLRPRVARIPRRHRDHQCVVVVDTLPVPVRGRGLAVDGEAEKDRKNNPSIDIVVRVSVWWLSGSMSVRGRTYRGRGDAISSRRS